MSESVRHVRWWGARVLAGCLALGCAPSPAAVSANPEVPVVVADEPPATGSVEVELSLASRGLTARYEFPVPVERFEFAATGNVRRDGWTVVAPADATLLGDRVEAKSGATSFEFQLAPDPKEHDRVYPSLTRIGEGVALYGPSLFVSGVETSLVFDLEAGMTARPVGDAIAGYVFVGPDELVEEGNTFSVIGRSTVAPWLGDAISKEAGASLPYYAARLGPGSSMPTILMTDDSPGPMDFHGDVTSNGIIFLRFFGEDWKAENPRGGRKVAKFVRHEAFHLWNRGGAPGNPPWLHEGGAEYGAVLAATKAEVLSEAQALEQVSYYANACYRALGPRPLSELSANGSSVYSCGVFVQWLADLHTRRVSDGQRDVFDLWRELLGSSAAGQGYTAGQFAEMAGPLVALVATGGKWTELNAALEDYGAAIITKPSDEDNRAALIHELMVEACDSPKVGYWTADGFLRLDTGDNCGTLSGQPQVVAIERHALFGSATKALEASRKRCSKKATLRVELRDGSSVETKCPSELEVPEAFRVAAAPPLMPVR